MLASPLRVRQCMPTSTFSSTLIWLKQRWFWKVRAMPERGDAVRRQPGQLVLSVGEQDPTRRSPDAGR